MLWIAIVAKVHALGSFQSIVTSVVTSNHNQYHHQYHHQTRRLRLRRCRLCCFRDRPLDAGIESNERNPPLPRTTTGSERENSNGLPLCLFTLQWSSPVNLEVPEMTEARRQQRCEKKVEYNRGQG